LTGFSQLSQFADLNNQVHIFLAILAGWMNRKQQKVIEYLLEENRVLKQQFESTGKKLRLNNHQRRNLAKRGKAIGWAQLQKYATLVRPETILGWHRKLVALKYTGKRRVNTDRQKRMEVIRELCVKFAEENQGWGYGRIQGSLANLGYNVSMTTVGNILRAKGIVPSPDRGKQSNWQTFVRSHMDVMSVADFFTVEVWSLRGLVRYHVFFVMNLAKRQVEVVHIGCQVNGAVMAQLARNMTDSCEGILKGARFFVCDHDPLYTKEFRQLLTDSGVEVIQTRVGCPQQNGYAESFVSAIKRECIDHMIFFSEKSLRRAVGQYIEHFHHERNHQGLDNLIPFPDSPLHHSESGLIVKSERLGGLLNYYHREEKEVGRAA
jgi:transposase InsO family protein